jgi:hypothetical protein
MSCNNIGSSNLALLIESIGYQDSSTLTTPGYCASSDCRYKNILPTAKPVPRLSSVCFVSMLSDQQPACRQST